MTTTALYYLKQKLKATAAERDQAGGTAFNERQLIRESGLLKLFLPERFGGATRTGRLFYSRLGTLLALTAL